MKREVEVLYQLKTPAKRAEHLLADQATPQGHKRTLDVYYFDPKRPDLKPRHGRLSRCFRLRLKDGQASLTYKVDKFRGDEWLHSEEYETVIDDFSAAQDIIGQLGLKELVRVDMIKTMFETDEFDIAVERVRGLGNFLEVESRRSVTDRKADKEKARIRTFVESLGLRVDAEMNAGKPELMLHKQQSK